MRPLKAVLHAGVPWLWSIRRPHSLHWFSMASIGEYGVVARNATTTVQDILAERIGIDDDRPGDAAALEIIADTAHRIVGSGNQRVEISVRRIRAQLPPDITGATDKCLELVSGPPSRAFVLKSVLRRSSVAAAAGFAIVAFVAVLSTVDISEPGLQEAHEIPNPFCPPNVLEC